MSEDDYSQWIAEAAKLGKRAGKNAAEWATQGISDRQADALLKQLADCDDQLEPPNLSGEFADSETPGTLAAQILPADGYGDIVSDLCDAWEAAASDAFYSEIDRICNSIAYSERALAIQNTIAMGEDLESVIFEVCEIASEWHNGQSSPLYSLASTGKVHGQDHLDALISTVGHYANDPHAYSFHDYQDLEALQAWLKAVANREDSILRMSEGDGK